MRYFNKAMLVASAALCLNLSVFSQNITLKTGNVTVKEAMEQLKKSSGYSFVFSSVDVDTQKHISISVQDGNIDDVVRQILAGQIGITYEIKDKNIIIKKSENGVVSSKKLQTKGSVRDVNGEPIIGATVMERGTSNGTITDIDGNFMLEVPEGAMLDISYVGYKNQSVQVLSGKQIAISLREDSETLDEVVVIGYGAQKKVYVDPTLKWERTRTADFGIETGFFDNKLTLNAAYFHRKTTDVLYKPAASYSSIFGLAISEVNTGELENKGWEFEIGHQNTIGDFHYHVNGNFSIIKNKVLTLGMGNVTQNNGMIGNGSDLFIGYPMEMFYGYKTDGVFLTDAEVNDWYDQTEIAKGSQAGDIRYVDITGDGKVTPDDRTYLGSRIPKYTFGLNLGAEYKGFDFSMLIQGVAGVKGTLSVYAGYAFYQEGNIQRWQMENCWNVQQDNRYPEYPRLEVMSNAGSNNTLTSDYWVLNASYVKVRNIQFGYTLPESVTRKFGSSGMRFYVSLDNPLTFKSYREGWDPENTSNNGQYYPTMSTYTFGLTLKF